MPLSEFTALLLLATAMSFSPGPNTTLSTALAANRGLPHAMRFVCAVPVGWSALLLLCAGGVGALVLAVPLLIQYVIQGAASVESRFGFDYIRCIGVGLIVAGIGGAASLAFGVEFLTSGHAEPRLPLVGDVALASAMVFDTGVYLVVFGGAMLILSMLGTIKPSRTRVAQVGTIEPGQRSTRTGEVG